MKIQRKHYGYCNTYCWLEAANTMRLAWRLAKIWDAPSNLLRSLRDNMRWNAKQAVICAKQAAAQEAA
jgi:hypothetical protein